jgi:hypothetical protein
MIFFCGNNDTTNVDKMKLHDLFHLHHLLVFQKLNKILDHAKYSNFLFWIA